MSTYATINNAKTATIVLLTAMVMSLLTAPVLARSPVQTEIMKAANVKTSGAFVRERFLKLMKKPFVEGTQSKVLIIGDSHAQDFLNSVLESGNLKNYQLSTRYIPARCQIFLGDPSKQVIASKDNALCEKSDNLLQAKQQIAQADIIILAANWKEWSAKALPTTIKQLQLSPQQKLFVVGRKSFGKIKVRQYLRTPEEQLTALHNRVDAIQPTINKIMNETLGKDVFVNVHDLLCDSPTQCPVFTPNKQLISFDGGHLTKDGARYVGKILFQQSPLAQLEGTSD